MKKEKGKFVAFLKKIGGKAVDLLFPKNIKCVFCNNDVPDFENKMICEECENDLPFNNENKCGICSHPISNEAKICDICQKNKRYFKKAFCPFVYSGKVRKAILGYKDSNQRWRAEFFSKYIFDEIKRSGLEFDFITFVPMTKKKLKRRGFNQAKLLAEELSKLMNLPVQEIFTKKFDGKMQKFSTYKERQENVDGMYALLPVKLKRKSSILIVDDIITSCATVNACSKLVYKRVKSVYVCAVARNKLNFGV